MKRLPANVIVSRATGGGEDQIHLTIEDERSGRRIMELYFELADWARASTASYGRAMMEYYPEAPIGKMHETKTEAVPFKGASYENDFRQKVAAALAPFEIDGWKGDASNLGNHHYRAKSGDKETYRVTFHRYVEWPEGKPERRDEQM